MKSEDIHLDDWVRVLFGNVPAAFYIEATVRVVILFCLLILAMRLLGRRMAAQLSRTEMLAMSSLAAATGIPLLSPDRGVLPAVISMAIIILIGRGTARRAVNNQQFEKKIQGNIALLVKDAVLQFGNMRESNLSLQRVFAQLRSEKIKHLGEVKRFYIEANGSFTLIKEEKPQPGLSILPAKDPDFVAAQKQTDVVVCNHCGKKQETADRSSGKCSNCGQTNWGKAII